MDLVQECIPCKKVCLRPDDQPWCDSAIRRLSLNHGATAQSEDFRSTMVRQYNQKTFAQPWCDSAIRRPSLNHGVTAQSEDFRSTMVRQRNRKTFAQPWCDSAIRRLSRQRDRMKRTAKASGKSTDWSKYKNLRNNVNNIKKKTCIRKFL